MQKFTEFVNEHKASIALQTKTSIADKFNELYEAKLRELGAISPLDLSERDSRIFYDYLKSLNEGDMSQNESSNGKIKSEKDFREYAEAVLRKAHPKDYDEKIAKKIMDDLSKQVKDNDWGPAIGKLTSGLG
jgi:hypothetical protein